MGDFFEFVIRFFYGWRRKTGCVMLVLACVFMSGSVRANRRSDLATVWVTNGLFFRFASNSDGIDGMMLANVSDKWRKIHNYCTEWRVRENGYEDYHHEYIVKRGIQKGWNFIGFSFREGRDDRVTGIQFKLVKIPYWSIVIPLTLLSAYLLISKPRQSNQKKMVEPVQDEEGA